MQAVIREIVKHARKDGGDSKYFEQVGTACHRYLNAALQRSRAGEAERTLVNLSLTRSAFCVDVQRGAKFGDGLG